MICARLSSRIVRSLTLITVVLFIVAFQSPMTTAQTAEFTQGSKNSNTLTFEVPLGNYPGRGISLPVTLRYSSQGLWRVGFINSVQVNVWGYNIHRSVAEAIYAEHSTAGWQTSLDVPKIAWPKLNDRYFANGNPYARGYVYPYTHRVANVYVHMPDGSTHELRKADQIYQDNNYVDTTGTFYAVDGSRMRYDSSGATTGTLYLPDGTRWIFNGSTVQYIDRNGNTLNYDTATRQWTDTLGRVFNMPWPANPGAGDYTYQLPGVNGSVLNYTLKFRHLSDVLAPGTPALQPMGDYYLPNPASPPTSQNGGNFPQPTGTSTMFTSEYVDEENQASYTYVVGRMQSGANVFNPVVLSEVVLPNGRNYVFSYNNYGELAKVVLPTGGYQRYAHSYVSPLASLHVPFNQGSRGMTSQWISPSGSGTDESQWTYLTTGTILTVTAPDDTGAPNGLRSETLIHYNSAQNSNFGYQDARTGLPYEQRVYAPASQGGAMLRRTLTEYAQTSATYTRPSPYSGTYTAYRNARATKSVSLMLDTGGNALASSRTTSYDTTYQFSVGLDATASNEYGFAIVDQTTAQTAPISSMPFGPLVRSTQTSFLTSDPGYRNRNILGLASYVTISNGASQIVSQSSFAYDEAGYPLLTYGSLTGWTDPQTSYRGNATSANRWLDYPTSTWLSTHTQYDQAGSARNAWDARGNQSQVEYSATYARALPTQTTTAVPDPTGTHGTTTPLVATANYDFNTGLVTSTTDANAKTTTFEYSDPMNRITRVNFPDGGRTTTTYVDAHSCGSYIQTRTLLTASGTETDSYTFFDGLGRPYRALTYENQDTGNPYLTLDTQYDKLGRSWRTSNPYRSNGCTSAINPAGTWTTNAYDSLSRVISITTPDGAQASTVYSASTSGSYIGPSVTVTDPAGKARKSISDSSGRVIQVIEDPNGLAYQTNYAYDALNNLRRVEQGSQLRFYGYDSLSRVIRVNSVEQTVNGALNWSDPVTGNTAWTMGLSYDANGNVTSRVDARNISTNITYDALNRPIIQLYRINGQPDPNTGDVEYLYDNAAANGRGRPWITFTWGANPFQTAVGGYDAVGRVTQLHRLFGNGQGGWHPSYDISATYDLAGNTKSITYPSGHTVNYSYDAAARPASFTGNLGGGAQRTYATGIEYSPFGGMSREQYGTQTPLYHKSFYNVRGQMFDTRVSSVNDMWDWNRGRLISYFSANHVWGGSGTDNNGNVRFQEMWIPPPNATLDQAQYLIEDSYTYDALNRLTAVNESSLNIGGGGSWQGQFAQVYNYDRWGNRTVDQTNTWGAVPKPNFGVNAATNQLTAPAGSTMSYDAAGNLTNDTYTGQGARTYDAENHMKQAWGNNQWQTYVYDGGGKRIKRIVNGTETWQVHGLGGELVAEYAPVASPSSPQKEYGYRNGELLITAEAASGSGGSGSQPVSWTNAVGVTVSGNSLTKTTAEGWNAGAASAQTIASGDGYVEFTASETNKFRMCGLSNGDSNQNYTDIDFGLYLGGYPNGGVVEVYEGGVGRGSFGSYATGDVMRVAVEGGVVKYKKNGVVFYTSTVAPAYPLLVDAALYSQSSTLNSVVIGGNVSSSSAQNVNWTNAVGVSISGNSLTKTTAEGWNAGAASAQTIASGDGYVEFTATETTTFRMLGLSHGDSNQNYPDVDFGLYLGGYPNGGVVEVYEGGVGRGSFGSYATGDVMRVAVEGGVVKYKKNGVVFYTSTVAPAYPLLVDSAFYSNGSTISNVVMSGGGGGGGSQNVTWTGASGVAVNGNSLTKTTAEGWNAGAASAQTIASGDGYVEFTASETNTFRMLGLSHGDSNQNYTDIDFGLYLGGYPNGGVVEVYEGGVGRGSFGTYATGDVMRVAVEGGLVKYRKNGALLYTSSATPTYPLLVDASLYLNGATLTSAVISSGGGSGGGSSATIRWVVSDRLGTPRMIFDQTGSYASVSRHDYLPFGEELGAGVGGRTTGLGYTNLDGLRQHFTGYERDAESGLDYAQARYYASQQGRFTSVDPLGASADVLNPQSFNRYSYVLNSPTNLTDPSGMMPHTGAGADVGWSGVADGFWGNSFDFSSPPRQNHIATAMARRDSIMATGYDPAFDVYWGDVEVQYSPGADTFTVSTTLHNPTPDQIRDAAESLTSVHTDTAQRGTRTNRSSGSRSNPRNDLRNYRWVPNKRGGGQWRYTGPVTWREGTVHPTSLGRPVPGVQYHRHHIFPQQFRETFEALGINIDQTTLLMPASVHRGLHPQWNRDWQVFFNQNRNPSRQQVFRFGVDLMIARGLHNYSVVPFR